MQTNAGEIKKRLAELETLIRETRERLPAHSAKPSIMHELLAYEDEYESLLATLRRMSDQGE